MEQINLHCGIIFSFSIHWFFNTNLVWLGFISWSPVPSPQFTLCPFYVLLSFSFFNSETVKFGHVTFFWNGNRSGCFDSSMEEYVEIPSDSGITFNVKPKMKALEIAEKARDAILSRKFHQVLSGLGIWYSRKPIQVEQIFDLFHVFVLGSC